MLARITSPTTTRLIFPFPSPRSISIATHLRCVPSLCPGLPMSDRLSRGHMRRELDRPGSRSVGRARWRLADVVSAFVLVSRSDEPAHTPKSVVPQQNPGVCRETGKGAVTELQLGYIRVLWQRMHWGCSGVGVVVLAEHRCGCVYAWTGFVHAGV